MWGLKVKPQNDILHVFHLKIANFCQLVLLQLQEDCERYQTRARSLKKQLEDAEEIAALNLAKYKKAQAEVEEAEERANLTEQSLSKSRAKSILAGNFYPSKVSSRIFNVLHR